MVDSGSCANMVFAELVARLGLQVIQHRTTYSLHWLSHQGVVYAHKQVHVSLSIGAYIDYFTCGAVPMDAALRM